MKIVATNVSKKFRNSWVVKDCNLEINSGERISFCGSNGSGKSTLLKILSTNIIPSKGAVSYFESDNSIDTENISDYIAICAPYLSLYSDHTLQEAFDFHTSLKPLKNNISGNEFFELCMLTEHKNKRLGHLSTGMGQRLKLGLAILSNANVVFLDEPLSNLDYDGIKWYKKITKTYLQRNQTVLVFSNSREDEYYFCTRRIEINNWE